MVIGEEDRLRNHSIVVKLSKEEKKNIMDKANKLDMAVSTYLRILGLNSNFKIETA